MSEKWLILGISGATCGGKTTIANKLIEIFTNGRVISQDNYFLPVDDDRHVWIPELNHINFDILTSLDMDKMHEDIEAVASNSTCHEDTNLSNHAELVPLTSNLSRKELVEKLAQKKLRILIVEGFCIFYHKPIESLCDLKYFITLNKEECYKRRMQRVYEPPDCPGYFENCVWPEYLRQLEDVKSNVENVTYISEFTEDPIEIILEEIKRTVNSIVVI